MEKINVKKIKNGLNRFARFCAQHVFLGFLISVFISLSLGGILFYQYDILAARKEPEVVAKPIQFEENLYQKILTEWQERGERFEGAEKKVYPDPFK